MLDELDKARHVQLGGDGRDDAVQPLAEACPIVGFQLTQHWQAALCQQEVGLLCRQHNVVLDFLHGLRAHCRNAWDSLYDHPFELIWLHELKT